MVDTSNCRLGGDPNLIVNSAARWGIFATTSHQAAEDLRRIDADDFIGDEADLYRGKLDSQLTPHLDTTSQAWDVVSEALKTYASSLEGLQSRMTALAAQADQQQMSAARADADAADARAADTRHAADAEAAKAALKPGGDGTSGHVPEPG